MFVFIVGRGRSGTTLLKSMLDRHEEISIAPESLFVLNTYRRYKNGLWSRERILKFYRDIWLEGRLKTWGIDQDKLKKNLLKSGCDANFSDLCEEVYRQYASENGKQNAVYIGDKNPHHALFLRQLIDVFPDARFVHILRDYRDNICSYQSVGFDLNKTSSLAYRWLKYNQEIIKVSQDFPERFVQVRFEGLVENTECELKKICAFMNVEYKSEMLKQLPNESFHSQSWHENLSKPPDPNLINQWKVKMNKSDVALSDRICGEFAQNFDYCRVSDAEYRLNINNLFGVLYAWLYTFMEKVLFIMPIMIRSKIIAYYRSITR